MKTRSLLLIVPLLLAACGDDLPSTCPRGKPIREARAIDGATVEVLFACRLDESSASDREHWQLGNFAVEPPGTLAVHGASARSGIVQLSTAEQTALVGYTVRLSGVMDADGNPLTGSANFLGAGKGGTAEVTLLVDDRYNANLKKVTLIVSVDPLTGLYSHSDRRLALADPDGDHRFETKLRVAVDPARTIDSADDRLGARYMAYTARAVDEADRPLSPLTPFAVTGEEAKTVSVPLLTVPKPPPPEGLVTVSFKVDDRPARALAAPSLRASIDSAGSFDAGFPTTVSLADKDGDNVWEGSVKVRIDPGRVAGGSTAETKPYSVYLVEGETPYSARSADFAVVDEKPVEVGILIGAKDKVPVTFRVDVAQSWLELDGSQRGVYPGEAVFLTGEFGVAEDAFGQNATDAFNGGENVVLQMSERKDRPGVWERTIFLPGGRPYGWKVVRCPKDKGCTQLNKMVSSSGRAFPTVMKNLATELCDLGKTSWTDPECKSPKLIDPRKLDAVATGAGGTLDYSKAKIHEGSGGGVADQKDPKGTPNPTLMFKQEAPDLVADVKDKPLELPVFVVGTWRDVNIPGTPADLLTGGQVIDLTKTDYDAGQIGAMPPSYPLPPSPKPSPFKMDGILEGSATLVAGGSGTMPIHVALSGNHLYLATDDAGEGSDNFLLVSASVPGTPRAAPWGKGGTVAFVHKTLFMADENDSGFCGWFELGSPDKLLASMGGGQDPSLDVATGQNGGVLEGTIDLQGVFGQIPTIIYLATAPWSNPDGGLLYGAAQTPATKDGNGNIDAGEILKLSLPSLKVLP